MQITTTFSCGDKGWVFSDSAQQLTIGQIRVQVTNSPGVDDGQVEPGCSVQFDNYKPQSDYEEQYMCVETGIGSGSIYTLNKHIFITREACELANADRIREIAEQKEQARLRREREALAREASLRRELDEIERIKAAREATA